MSPLRCETGSEFLLIQKIRDRLFYDLRLRNVFGCTFRFERLSGFFWDSYYNRIIDFAIISIFYSRGCFSFSLLLFHCEAPESVL